MPGHNPSHEAKCLALLKRDRSGPTSAMTFSAVVVSMPSMSAPTALLGDSRASGQSRLRRHQRSGRNHRRCDRRHHRPPDRRRAWAGHRHWCRNRGWRCGGGQCRPRPGWCGLHSKRAAMRIRANVSGPGLLGCYIQLRWPRASRTNDDATGKYDLGQRGRRTQSLICVDSGANWAVARTATASCASTWKSAAPRTPGA